MRVLQSWSQSSSLHGLIKALQAAIHSGEAAQYSADVLFVPGPEPCLDPETKAQPGLDAAAPELDFYAQLAAKRSFTQWQSPSNYT